MATIVAIPGAVNANSYETLAEANVFFQNRIPLDPPWVEVGDASERALITATRALNSFALGTKRLVREGDRSFFIVGRKWTGNPTTTTQALPWPRVGMYDSLGRAIPDNVIPQELKDAESELAGQLKKSDRLLDNDVAVQGITSVSAGSVSVSFKESGLDPKVLPDSVVNLMPASWFTDESVEPAQRAEFTVL